ncbi:MAG: hypothetical protein ACJAUV_000095 [Flavobacteriales bacterium]|jgi:hypothetical protein
MLSSSNSSSLFFFATGLRIALMLTLFVLSFDMPANLLVFLGGSFAAVKDLTSGVL